MFATVYIVWAIFLFGSAREPLTHRLFLDFNLTANAAHFTAMLAARAARGTANRRTSNNDAVLATR